MYNASVEGALGHVFVGKDVRTALITCCPTQSEWFEKFALGCLKRMGQVVKSNMAITMDVALELLRRLETAGRQRGGWEHLLLLMVGAAVVIGMRGSLRGHEIFLTDLLGVRKHLSKGKVATPTAPSHIFVTLLGRFKGETGERYHLTPLASMTDLGLPIRRWITMLVVAWDMRGIRSGPLFREHNGEVMAMAKLDGIMHRYLLQIQSDRSDLIPADLDVTAEYSLHRSL